MPGSRSTLSTMPHEQGATVSAPYWAATGSAYDTVSQCSDSHERMIAAWTCATSQADLKSGAARLALAMEVRKVWLR
jgi:hypothetical protein